MSGPCPPSAPSSAARLPSYSSPRPLDALFFLPRRRLGVLLVERPGDEAAHQVREALAAAVVGVAHSLDAGQHRLDLADRLGHPRELRHQPRDDALLDRAPRHQIQHLDRLVDRAEPLNAADALLQDHRVPRQVVVDQHVGGLQVDPLRAGVGRDQHAALGVRLREPLGVGAVGRAAPPGDQRHPNAAAFEVAANRLLRLAAAREHDRAPVRVGGGERVAQPRERGEFGGHLRRVGEAACGVGRGLQRRVAGDGVGELRRERRRAAHQRLAERDLFQVVEAAERRADECGDVGLRLAESDRQLRHAPGRERQPRVGAAGAGEVRPGGGLEVGTLLGAHSPPFAVGKVVLAELLGHYNRNQTQYRVCPARARRQVDRCDLQFLGADGRS